MHDQEKSTSRTSPISTDGGQGEAARVTGIRAGLLSDVPTAWNAALRTVLLECVGSRRMWFSHSAEIADTAERESSRAALADLVLYLVFER